MGGEAVEHRAAPAGKLRLLQMSTRVRLSWTGTARRHWHRACSSGDTTRLACTSTSDLSSCVFAPTELSGDKSHVLSVCGAVVHKKGG